MLSREYLRESQLEQARSIADATGERDLTPILLSLGFIGERELALAMSLRMGCAFADLEKVPVDSTALALIPREIAQTWLALPLKKDGNNLWVAMADPSDREAIEKLHECCGCRIIPVAAAASAIAMAITRGYSTPEDGGASR
ncbi:hypothetical protein [Fimbriimonas ginsengisoli]|nr:hypothetical protein [Fimbriimonas ginsengisoli]